MLSVVSLQILPRDFSPGRRHLPPGAVIARVESLPCGSGNDRWPSNFTEMVVTRPLSCTSREISFRIAGTHPLRSGFPASVRQFAGKLIQHFDFGRVLADRRPKTRPRARRVTYQRNASGKTSRKKILRVAWASTYSQQTHDARGGFRRTFTRHTHRCRPG